MKKNFKKIQKEYPLVNKNRFNLIMSTYELQNDYEVLSLLNSIEIRYLSSMWCAKLPFKKNYFDLKISLNVFEHTAYRIKKTLLETKMVLNEDGVSPLIR